MRTQKTIRSLAGRLALLPLFVVVATAQMALGNETTFSLDAYQLGFSKAAAQASELRQILPSFNCTQSLHQEKFAFGLNPSDRFSSRYTIVRNDNQLVIISIIARSPVEVQNLAVASALKTFPTCDGFTSTSEAHRNLYFF